MKLTKGRIATHAAAFALALMAGMGAGAFRDGKAGDFSAAGKGGEERGTPRRPDRPGRGAMKETAGNVGSGSGEKFAARDFKAAWDAIAFRKVTLSERMELQEALLRKWAEVDLEGALRAALATNWDAENGFAGVGNLLASFEDVFAERPLEAWGLIGSGKLGLGAEMVKVRWAEAVAREHPMLVMSTFDELPARCRGETLKTITEAVTRDPALREEFLAKLCALPQTGQLSTWMSETIRKLGPSGTASEVGAKLAAAETDQQRTRYIHELGLALKTAELAEILAEMDKLPEELRNRASRSVLLHADPRTDIPGLVTRMMGMGEWDNLREQGGKISEYGYKTGKAAELAQWTFTLPDRRESRDILIRAVEPYIVNDPAGAKSWIESLPAGDWRRDQALAEYSRHVLWRMNDKELSAWAIDAISDPKVKEHGIGVRTAWARQKGVEP